MWMTNSPKPQASRRRCKAKRPKPPPLPRHPLQPNSLPPLVHPTKRAAKCPLSEAGQQELDDRNWVDFGHPLNRRPGLDPGLGLLSLSFRAEASQAPCQARGDEQGNDCNGIDYRKAAFGKNPV